MASIFRRGKQRIWCIKYYVNGRQVYHSLNTTDARVAKKMKRQIEGEEAKGELLAPSKTPLPAFLDDFCRFLATMRTPKSYSADVSVLRVFFGPICPALELGSNVNKRWRSSPRKQILTRYEPQRRRPWFFPSTRGFRWDPDNFSEDLRDINRSCGLAWSSLDFRHTFGSHLAQKGESLYKIAELMGNSPEICRKHYAALVPEKMHDVVEFEACTSDENEKAEEMLQQILDKLGHSSPQQDKPKLRIVKSHG